MALELPKFTKKEKSSDKPDITLQIAQFFEKRLCKQTKVQRKNQKRLII